MSTTTADANTTASQIELKGVRFAYPGADDEAIRGVDLTAIPGAVTALVGPSGCGKTTLLRLVAGLLYPTAGELHIDGSDASLLSVQARHVGWVPQGYALFDHLDVRGNVEFGLRMRSVPRRDRQRRIDEALELCQIGELGTRSVRDLSGGQRQRVAIARALVTQPRVLLLDEPLAALDPQLRRRLRGDLAVLLRETGVTTLLVTHDQSEAMAMADQVAVIRAGLLEQVGPPDALWGQPGSGFVAEFVGAATIVDGVGVGEHQVQLAPNLHVDVDRVIADGAEVTVAVRPGHLLGFAPSESATTAAPGTVVATEYVGGGWRSKVRCDDAEAIVLEVSTSQRFDIGARIHIAGDEENQAVVVER